MQKVTPMVAQCVSVLSATKVFASEWLILRRLDFPSTGMNRQVKLLSGSGGFLVLSMRVQGALDQRPRLQKEQPRPPEITVEGGQPTQLKPACLPPCCCGG